MIPRVVVIHIQCLSVFFKGMKDFYMIIIITKRATNSSEHECKQKWWAEPAQPLN